MTYDTSLDPISPNFDPKKLERDLWSYDIEMAAQRFLVRHYPHLSH